MLKKFFKGPEKELQLYTLVQYLFGQGEHNAIKLLQHGISKMKHPYHQLLHSTLDTLQDSKASAKKPMQYFDKDYRSMCEVFK